MIDSFQQFTTSLPPLLQWLGVMAAGAVPFIESYFGAVIGVAAGLNPVIAVVAAVVGNFVSMAALVWGAHAARRSLVGAPSDDEPVAPRRRRLRRAFDRFGVPGVSLLGQTILPSQITATALVSFGAQRNAVVLWQAISITLWGIAFGALATFGIAMG